jgi:hypothetical protein
MEEDAARQELALDIERQFPDLSRVVRGDWDDQDCREVAGLWTFPSGTFGDFSELPGLPELPELLEAHEDADDGVFGHFSEPPEMHEDTDDDDSAASGVTDISFWRPGLIYFHLP